MTENSPTSTTLKRFFNTHTAFNHQSLLTEAAMINGAKMSNSNYVSTLPEVYSGAPNRVDRYNQYESMDLDSHISASLDIIAEFCTQIDPVTKVPFALSYLESPTESDSKILTKMLSIWSNTNDFPNQLYDIFRDTLKYGDQFFIRDPQTYQWLRIYHGYVEKVIVNESKGKVPEQYVVRDLDYNLQNLSVSQIPSNYGGSMPSVPASTMNSISANSRAGHGATGGTRFGNAVGSTAVNAEHIIHLNMTKRGDPAWPFGTSMLEKVFKTYKQKELIEDAILIYRIQRAPMRRIFKIDVGDIPDTKAMQFVEQVKNSVSQRRIPSRNGGGASVTDASYNPIGMLDDFFLPQKADGRGSSIDTLPGGDASWGIDELQYFDNKLARGLRVPSSYLPTGPEDSNSTYNDGKVGTALIQEYRFSEMCKRIQRAFSKKFDEEFKLYLKKRDINIDSSTFSLGFVEPQNFITWRQIEIDSSRINNFNQVSQQPYFSKRWAMERFLGLTPDEINKNHEMIMEENPSKFSTVNSVNNILDKDVPVDLRSVGFSNNDFNDAADLDSQTDDIAQPLDTANDLDADGGGALNTTFNTPQGTDGPAPQE